MVNNRITNNIKRYKTEFPAGVRLVAVSKYHTLEQIQEAYAAGQRIFGESRVQELLLKREQLPVDIEWHFIGHLQTNKVKHIAPFIALIHSVDSLDLLKETNRCAAKNNRIIDCLLQLHIAEEETKYGFSFEELRKILVCNEWLELKNIRICGLMAMASFTEDENQIRNEFASLKAFYEELKVGIFANSPEFKELSMGMSSDYSIAIEQGSTLVRIGSGVFV